MFTKMLTGQTLVLRAYQKEDVPYWQRWDTDQLVQAYMPASESAPTSDEEQLAYLEVCRDENNAYYWSIVWKENSSLIGSIALTDVNHHHGLGELGVVIGERESWGKGVATEAIGLVVACAFSEMGLRKITAEYEEGNTGIEKALLKNNFQKECIKLQSRIKVGAPINTVSYFILRKD
ncbi:MAG: GNAT family N-acetyltransferase [Candidatus Azambacteria bacterium]|nr:GNAT family N-acetyltransferase [Candidatus Azambacteria bacterium]